MTGGQLKTVEAIEARFDVVIKSAIVKVGPLAVAWNSRPELGLARIDNFLSWFIPRLHIHSSKYENETLLYFSMKACDKERDTEQYSFTYNHH